MELLGKLGIDAQLLIAQIINFGLLLLLLKLFLYGPIIRRIEKDEKELNEAQIVRKKLEQEKIALAKQKEHILEQAHEQVRQIIAEAEEMARHMKTQTKEKIQTTNKSYVQLARQKLSLEKYALEKHIFEEAKQSTRVYLQKIFFKKISDKVRHSLENAFFDQLINQLEKFPLNMNKKITNLIKNWEKNKKFADTREHQKLLEKFLATKIGPVVLWYTRPPSNLQRQQLIKLIKIKLGFATKFIERQDKAMIIGARLEMAGFVIESNLWQMINYSFKQKENE